MVTSSWFGHFLYLHLLTLNLALKMSYYLLRCNIILYICVSTYFGLSLNIAVNTRQSRSRAGPRTSLGRWNLGFVHTQGLKRARRATSAARGKVKRDGLTVDRCFGLSAAGRKKVLKALGYYRAGLEITLEASRLSILTYHVRHEGIIGRTEPF